MNNKEIEFKYSAENVSLETFNAFCKGIHNHELYRYNLGQDHFYTNPDKPGTFFRIREDEGDLEVTFKRKIQDDNQVRVEYNLGLSRLTTKEQAHSLLEELGWSYDTSLTKVNHVHLFPWYVLSYYICYDANMVEKDRFIEIEMREDAEWSTEHEVFNELKIVERMFRPLGLSHEGRLVDSLYERYRSKK